MIVSGLLLIDKPAGMTSHDLVALVRRGASLKRVGHAGTLDPLATGLMLILLGDATRLSEYLVGVDKVYEAAVRLGLRTDTDDLEGEVIEQRPLPTLSVETIEAALESFTGLIQQRPPAYSAIKIAGREAYKRARAGEEIDLPARPVTIYDIELLGIELPLLQLRVHCSSGTYIRSLARDLGESLGSLGTLNGLRRLRCGIHEIDAAISLDALNLRFADGSWTEALLSPAEALAELPQLLVSDSQTLELVHGRAIPAPDDGHGPCCAIDSAGDLVAMLDHDAAAALWRPTKVFAKPASR